MTGERLLEAIGYIDPALVEDARRLPVRRRLGRRALTVGLAAAPWGPRRWPITPGGSGIILKSSPAAR